MTFTCLSISNFTLFFCRNLSNVPTQKENVEIILTHFQSTRRSHRNCFIRKVILRNFAKITGKHLCHSLFLNKVAGAYQFCEISKNTLFYRIPLGGCFWTNALLTKKGRSCPWQMFFKLGALKNFANFTGKQSLFYTATALQACNFIKKRLQHKYFLMKFYETFKNTLF